MVDRQMGECSLTNGRIGIRSYIGVCDKWESGFRWSSIWPVSSCLSWQMEELNSTILPSVTKMQRILTNWRVTITCISFLKNEILLSLKSGKSQGAMFNDSGTDWASWWWPCLWIFIVKTYLKAEYSNEIWFCDIWDCDKVTRAPQSLDPKTRAYWSPHSIKPM